MSAWVWGAWALAAGLVATGLALLIWADSKFKQGERWIYWL